MNQEVADYFNELASSAMSRSRDRVADRKFFEQVRVRIEAGESLTAELPQLAHLETTEVLGILDNLVKRCDSEMRDYWAIPSNSGIESEIRQELRADEVLPRITATYTATTEVGMVTVTVSSKGNRTDVQLDTSRVQNMDTARAINELASQLLVARMAAT